MIMKHIPTPILNGAYSLLFPFIPDLNPERLLGALKNFEPSPVAAQPTLTKPLKQKEALALLGVSQPTLTKFIKNGHLKACKLPGSSLLRIDAASLQALLDGEIVNSNNESASINTTEVSQ